MDSRYRGSIRWLLAGGILLVFFALVSAWPVPAVQGYGVVGEGRLELTGSRGAQESANIHLAEMVQREDSIVYSTDGKDREYQQRQREERDKEKKSWNMLNNVIIDGRQPPRRFSDPRVKDPSQ